MINAEQVRLTKELFCCINTVCKMQDLPTRYCPEDVEGKWYRFWEEKKLFTASPQSSKKSYCIVIPPPNITGSLHMGHALDETLQDIVIRFKRMQGFNTFWVPGCDHAGIAAENVVERELAKENISKHQLGRERFIGKMWEWKEKHEKKIISELKKLGCSCDWSRFAFTMDEKRSEAVREAFARLFREGYIYRGNYIVNWCPHCQTALSNVEVEYETIEGKLFYINYPLKEGKGQITVATTRPETMLGDTAVAVHPEDKRYRRLAGKKLVLPLVMREIPIVFDERVDPSFGTGAVKVTPAHDVTDFEIGKTHGLSSLVIMDREGKMGQVPQKYRGMDRFKCREAVVEDLRREGYLLKIAPHTHSVGHCYRCGTMIEPYLSTQWFVNIQKLKQPAIKVIKNGALRFLPERWTKIYLDWMNDVRDWCISRQIWWGHPIPVYHCEECEHINVYVKEEVESCHRCGSEKLRKETDVLDTWFSSSLWPMTTLGWPQATAELKTFYPTSTLITGYDIIYFWVSRMIIMGLKLGGDIPFQTVYIHPIIRDNKGRKMSKSEGNVVDPLELIEKFGTDAVRMALAQLNTGTGQDIIFSRDRFEGMRNFSNKIWNASRFVMRSLGDDFKPVDDIYTLSLPLDEKCILREMEGVTKKVTKLLENFQFSEASEVLFRFFWHEFCDWYIELAKWKLRRNCSENFVAKQTLYYVLNRVMRLLHPFMPFITEEIWNYLSSYDGRLSESIVIADWPQANIGKVKKESIEEAKKKYEVIQGARNLRAEWNFSPKQPLDFVVIPASEEEERILTQEKESIASLINAKSLEISRGASATCGFSSQVTTSGTCVYLLLKEIDLQKERVRVEGELLSLDEKLKKLEKKLANHDFVSKASPEAVEKKRATRQEYLKKREKLLEILKIIAVRPPSSGAGDSILSADEGKK